MLQERCTAYYQASNMSQFLVGHGSDRHLPTLGDSDWQIHSFGNTKLAWQADSWDTDNGGLFASSDGQCVGLLAGPVFNLEQALATYPQAFSHSQRLGLYLHELYQAHSTEFPNQLDGSFALIMVLGDTLMVIRDAMGERPLYLLQHPQGVLVSDRMAPLLAHLACERRLHPGAVSDFLGTGFCPFERTPVQGISKIPAGAIWTIRGNQIHQHQYHRLSESTDPSTDSRTHAQHIRDLLMQSVEKRRLSKYKTGLLLSGGLDSSLVGALVGGDHLEAAYSLSFGESYRNELAFSGLMARHLGIPHRVITVSPQAIRQEWLNTMKILDEPIGDPLTVPNVLVAQAAAHEVQVIFNGEGGDPLFGGPKNLPMLAATALPGTSLDLETLYLMSYNKGSQLLSALFSPEFTKLIGHYPASTRLLSPYLRDTTLKTLLHRLMLTNTRLKGAAQILPKAFKIASASNLVVRSPLFDRCLAEAAFRIPPGLKLKGSVEKFILKQAVKDLLPTEVLNRPKSGMLVPVQYWFRRELKSYAKDTLLASSARLRPVLQKQALKDLLAFRGGGVRGYHGDRIWLLLSLELWMQAHKLDCG